MVWNYHDCNELSTCFAGCNNKILINSSYVGHLECNNSLDHERLDNLIIICNECFMKTNVCDIKSRILLNGTTLKEPEIKKSGNMIYKYDSDLNLDIENCNTRTLYRLCEYNNIYKSESNNDMLNRLNYLKNSKKVGICAEVCTCFAIVIVIILIVIMVMFIVRK